MKTEDLLECIKQLIAAQQGYPAERITLETRLQTDTGMAGDDGYEFLKRFGDELGVDMSTLRYDEHFEPEGMPVAANLFFITAIVIVSFTCVVWPWLIPAWAVVFYFYLRHTSRDGHAGEIRVSDLLRSAAAQRWIYDYKAA